MSRIDVPALCFGLLAAVAPAYGGDVTKSSVPILAHYMPWFRAESMLDGQVVWEHWQWYGRGPKHDPDEVDGQGRRDIASVFYPLIGPYDGRDPVVLEYHFLSAKVAGIDGFIADWYGPGTYSDTVFAKMVSVAEVCAAKVAICLEEKSFFPGYSSAGSREEALDVAEGQIRHVLAAYGDSPAYLRVRGRPVFFLFVNHEQGILGRHVLTPDELRALLARFNGEIFFVRGHAEPDYAGIADGNFGWVGDAEYRSNFYASVRAQAASDRPPYAVGAAMPGFDDHGVWGWGNGPRVIERRGGETYGEYWRDAQAHRVDAVQIITWNDFQEGSTIEPSREYGFQYLNQTEEWAGRLNGRPVNLRDNAWPFRIYNLRRAIAGMDDEAARRELTEKMDLFVGDLLRGRRLFMSFRLKWMENRASQSLPASKGREHEYNP